MRVLYFDTETTGLPQNKYPPNHAQQPHITQLGFILEINGIDAVMVDSFIRPDNWRIHPCSGTGISAKSTELTGITQDMCEENGIPIADALEMFIICAEQADAIVCHNTAFDQKIIGMEYTRLRKDAPPREILQGLPTLCTMKAATPICRIPKKDGRTGHKWPKLEEAYKYFYNEVLEGAHSAIVDIKATRRVFHTLIGEGAFDEQFETLKKEGRLPADFADDIGAA